MTYTYIMKNNYMFKIMTLDEIYTQFIQKNVENENIFSSIKFLDKSLQFKEIVFCFLDKNKIIALLGLDQDNIENNLFHNKFISVDPLYTDQGLAKKLIEEQFIYIKNKRGLLINSKYYHQDFLYIKKYVDLYSLLYKVKVQDFGIDEKIEMQETKLKDEINCTFLISPPGGGKTTWIKNNSSNKEDIYDDISLNKNAIKEISISIREKRNLLIGDVNLCDYDILKKAWQTLLRIGDEEKIEVIFKNIVFLGEKEDYLNNIILRNDSRNVKSSLDRFHPLLANLISKQFIGEFCKVEVFKSALKLGNTNKL